MINTFSITPIRAHHGYLEAYSIRFEIGHKVLAYSGDTGNVGVLSEGVANADLFLCEANTNIGDPENPGHLSAFQAGKVAKEAGVRHLVIVHYSGKDSKEDMEKEIRRAGFEGIVNIASDLDSFTLES